LRSIAAFRSRADLTAWCSALGERCLCAAPELLRRVAAKDFFAWMNGDDAALRMIDRGRILFPPINRLARFVKWRAAQAISASGRLLPRWQTAEGFASPSAALRTCRRAGFPRSTQQRLDDAGMRSPTNSSAARRCPLQRRDSPRLVDELAAIWWREEWCNEPIAGWPAAFCAFLSRQGVAAKPKRMLLTAFLPSSPAAADRGNRHACRLRTRRLRACNLDIDGKARRGPAHTLAVQIELLQ